MLKLFALPIFAFIYTASNQRVDVTVIAPKKKKKNQIKPAVLFTKIMYIKFVQRTANTLATPYTTVFCSACTN